MEASWAGVIVGGCSVLLGLTGIIIVPAVKAYGSLTATLTRIEDSLKTFSGDFEKHVKKDETEFAQVHKESGELKSQVGGANARLLTLQERFGLVHHPQAVVIGAPEPEG